MQLKLDDADPLLLYFSPELDARHRTHVNYSAELVSLRMNGFFNVPWGKHTLHVQPTLPVYLSAFRQAHPDFLVPWLNAPKTNAAQALRSALNAPSSDSAMRFAFPAPRLDPHAFADQEQNAWRLARDNYRMDSGGQAADWLNRLGQTRRDYPPARQTVAVLWRQRTFYREILPASQPGDEPSQPLIFPPTRLSELFKPQRPIAVSHPTLEQAGELFVSGRFAPVPLAQAPPLLYRLPDRSYDSELRIAAVAAGSARTRFFVQFDREKPIEVSVDAKLAVPANELEPSTALAALRVLEQETQQSTDRVAGQPVGEFDLPFPMSEPGLIVMPLPQHVRQVAIFQESPAVPVKVSVACRAAKPFEFSEAGLLSLLSQTAPEAVLRSLADPHEPPSEAPESLRQLHNHFLPLSRLLNAHRLDFSKSVNPDFAPPNARLSSAETGQLKQNAANLERAGQLIEASENWNRIFWEGNPNDRSDAALSLMRDLDALGEDFLAAQYARYTLLKATAPEFPAAAVALLEKAARQADDPEQLEQLRAFLFTKCPCPRHLADLVEAFSVNSRDEMVLSAGWLLPDDRRPIELMLAAALHLNWWQTFDQLVDGLPPETKSFWQAQRDLAFYHFAEAETNLKQAGNRGAEMLRALEEGRRIRERLAAPGLNERLEALFAWEQWLAHQPGPRDWRDADDVAVQYSGAELLFNCEQNQFANYFRAEPGKPVRLRFVGPLRLRIDARPLLGLPFDKPVDDWLEIAEYGITNRVPVLQCVPNPSLQLTTASNSLVGVKTTASVEWGPGLHEVDVSLAGRSGLIYVQQERAILPTRILPTLNTERMRSVLTARQPSSTPPGGRITQANGLWWVPPELASRPPERGDSSKPELAAGRDTTSDISGSAGLTEVQRLRLALRLTTSPEQSTNFSTPALQALPAAEQWLAACRWQQWTDFTNWNALPDVDRANYLMATHRIRELLDSNSPREVRERLNSLLQVTELSPAWRKEAQCLAESLAAQTNCPADCKNILIRMTHDLTWAPLPISPTSAGMRPIPVRADESQDPGVRIRRALLPPAETNQFTISAQNAFTASMTLQHPAEVQLSAELAKAGFTPLAPLTVSLQIDALEVQSFPLTPFAPVARTNFALPEGPHLVRVWIADPVVNQFVRIGFAGQSEAATNSIWSQSLTEAASENRFLHSATATQPIRFSWRGPALLRLDESRDGQTFSQFRFVPPGDQTVDIPPAPGRAESWYRIFVRATDTNQPESRLVWATREPQAVPPPESRLPEAVPPDRAQVADYYRLGGQEDGTWTADVMYVHRKPFEIDLQAKGVINKFVEVGAAYREMKPDEAIWFSTEALARVHQPGDLTLGLAERIEGRPRVLPINWAWSGEAYAGSTGPQQQNINGSLSSSFEIGPRLHLNEKLDDYPVAGFFANYLTLNPARVVNLNYIDHDLYTQFRYQHRYGWMLGNQIEYRPWLDALLAGSVDAASNENFSTDHWGMRFSWNQLLGPLRTEIGYRFTRFLSDSDRTKPYWKQGLTGGLFAEYWLNGRHHIEVGAQIRHDWPQSGNSYFLVLSWDFSNGRGYRDRGPKETGFRDLRNRSIPAAFNNSFQPGPPGATLP
jgi:hypothetical protein